jgi:hypothetical protein
MKKWTNKEYKVLQDLVHKYGIIQGSKMASITINRTFNACRQMAPKICAVTEDKRIFWTKDNIDAACDILSKNPENLNYAFKLIAEKLNTTATRVKSAYYCKSSRFYKNKIKANFLLFGKKSYTNAKVVKNNNIPAINTHNWFRRIIKAIFG